MADENKSSGNVTAEGGDAMGGHGNTMSKGNVTNQKDGSGLVLWAAIVILVVALVGVLGWAFFGGGANGAG